MAAASRDIAEAAKDDNSVMRTLAFMSIVFLPGTFVAVSRISLKPLHDDHLTCTIVVLLYDYV